jgi:hypothetical protein
MMFNSTWDHGFEASTNEQHIVANVLAKQVENGILVSPFINSLY